MVRKFISVFVAVAFLIILTNAARAFGQNPLSVIALAPSNATHYSWQTGVLNNTGTGEAPIMLNFSQYESVKSVYNNTLTIIENFITPTSAGISINGKPLILSLNVPVQFLNTADYTYFVDLVNISYAPILHTATLRVYRRPITMEQPSTTTPTTTIQTTPVNTTPEPVSVTTIVPTRMVPEGPTLSALLPWIGEGIAVVIAIVIGMAFPGRRKKEQK